MWILPKSIISAFAPGTEALISDSDEFSQVAEQSLMWRSKPSQQRTWSQRWKRDSWFRHLCGRILKPCQHTAFETELMSSLAVIPASRSAPLGCAKAPKTPDTSGHTSTTTYEQLDLFDASSRTSKDTSALDSDRSSMIWKDLVTKRRGEYSARLKLAHLTRESGSTSWLTPMVQDSKHSGLNQSKNGKRDLLVNQVQWPTPTASDSEFTYWVTPTATDGKPIRGGDLYQTKNGTVRAKNKDGTTSQRGLIEQVMWPTPAAKDHKGGYQGGRIRNGKVSKDTLGVAVQHTDNQSQSAGQLNPTWVEWLMGLPLGWTDLGFWGTE